MDRRELLVLAAALAGDLVLPRRAAAAEADTGVPPDPLPDAIFAGAKAAWRARTEVPFVQYDLRERYTWRATVHDNWWHVAYRSADGALALTRTIVAGDEAQRLRGSPIGLNFNWRNRSTRADSLDTNPGADAFPILDPLIEPNASFGLLRRDREAVLVAGGPRPEASLAPAPAPTPSDASPSAVDGSLRELVRVEAVARDYAIVETGLESIRGTDAYHLTLTPLRAPNRNRLRDLWVDRATSRTLQLAVHGLFAGKPYDDARWVVTYVEFNGRGYVQQIRTDETLRFGIDRYVSELQYDFVGYEFPETLPPIVFERLLTSPPP
jgi:hypothetical protein